MGMRIRAGMALTATAAMLTLAGCGTNAGDTGSGSTDSASESAASPASDVTEITVFQNANSGTPLGTLQREIYKAYEEKTGIKVVISDVPADNYVQAYEAAVAAGEEGDLLITNPTTDRRAWVSDGAVVDMNPYLDQWGLRDKLLDGALEGWSDPDGALMGIPYYGFTWPMLWNTAVLKEAGVDAVPQTKDELIAAAEKFKGSGKALISVAGGDWPGMAFFSQAIQTRTDNDTMRKVFQEGGYCDTESVKQSIQDFVDMRDAGVFPESAEGYKMDQQNTMFFNAEAAGLHGATWWFSDVPEAMRPDVQVGGIPVPADGPFKKPVAVKASTSMGFWMSQNGQEKADAIGELVKMFYQEEWAQKLVSDVAQVPNMKIQDVPESENPIYGQVVQPDFADSLDWVVLPDDQIPGDIKSPMEAAAAYQPGRTADEICAAMDSVYR